MHAIVLPERCDRGTAEALLPEFVNACPSGGIEVDGRAVTHAGLALLQLLTAARRSCDGVKIAPSPALRDAARLTGLERELFDEGDAA